MHRGFTLFEIAIVLALGIAVTSWGVITLSRLQTSFRLRSAADEIKSRLQYGRELAIANKDMVIYNIALSGTSVRLLGDNNEISRFQIPTGTVVYPPSFNWNITSITGVIPACSPCQITLSAMGLTEIINVSANGIID